MLASAVDRDNDGVVVNAFYRRSRIKTYLKDGRALRVETVINDAYDIGVLRRLEHFSELTAKTRDVNRRLMQTMRAGQGCVLAPSHRADRTAHPHRGWQEGPGATVRRPRVMALAGALSLTLSGTCGVTNKSPRALTARLLDTGYRCQNSRRACGLGFYPRRSCSSASSISS